MVLKEDSASCPPSSRFLALQLNILLLPLELPKSRHYNYHSNFSNALISRELKNLGEESQGPLPVLIPAKAHKEISLVQGGRLTPFLLSLAPLDWPFCIILEGRCQKFASACPVPHLILPSHTAPHRPTLALDRDIPACGVLLNICFYG